MNPTCPTVSVVIPAYRAAGTIATAVDSAIGQTIVPDEILVIDDGSPDDLAAALAPYAGRVSLIRKPNGGASSARNVGIDRSRGDLIAFLDADDYWEPTKVERQAGVFAAHPEVGLVATEHFVARPGGGRVPRPRGCPHLLDVVVRAAGEEVFEVGTAALTSTVMVRRSALGRHRFDETLTTAEDRDLWIRLASEGPTYMMADPLATWGWTPGSLSRSRIDADYTNMLEVIRRYAHLAGRPAVRRWEARVYSGWSGSHLAQRQPRKALPAAWQWFRRQPRSKAWRAVLLSLGGTVAGLVRRPLPVAAGAEPGMTGGTTRDGP